jgi:hypothetical protein
VGFRATDAADRDQDESRASGLRPRARTRSAAPARRARLCVATQRDRGRTPQVHARAVQDVLQLRQRLRVLRRAQRLGGAAAHAGQTASSPARSTASCSSASVGKLHVVGTSRPATPSRSVCERFTHDRAIAVSTDSTSRRASTAPARDRHRPRVGRDHRPAVRLAPRARDGNRVRAAGPSRSQPSEIARWTHLLRRIREQRHQRLDARATRVWPSANAAARGVVASGSRCGREQRQNWPRRGRSIASRSGHAPSAPVTACSPTTGVWRDELELRVLPPQPPAVVGRDGPGSRWSDAAPGSGCSRLRPSKARRRSPAPSVGRPGLTKPAHRWRVLKRPDRSGQGRPCHPGRCSHRGRPSRRRRPWM